MRGSGCLALLLLVATTSAVRADDQSRERANALVEEGNQLGQQGKHAEAIAKFEAAEELLPRALHNCNIGLAYTLLNEWEKAHFFLRRCQRRWKPKDGPAPDWLARNLAGVERKLASGDYGRLRIATEPPAATVVLSPFPGKAVDERELWVASGQHRLTVTADDHRPRELEVTVRRGESQATSVVLERKPALEPVNTAPTRPDPLAVSKPAPPARRSSKKWLYAGGATAGAGALLVAGGFLFRSRANDNADRIRAAELSFDQSLSDYRTYETEYADAKDKLDTNNALMVTSWIAGGVAVAAGTYMIVHALTGDSAPTEGPAVSITPTGAQASMSWSF